MDLNRALAGRSLERPSARQTPSELANSWLANALEGYTLGEWALDAWTLNYIEEFIRKRRPECVLEFGSGLSTLAIARFILETHGDMSRVRVCSVEQNADQAAQTNQLLDTNGLSSLVRVVTAPIGLLPGGVFPPSYSLNLDELSLLLGGCHPELVVIDGPHGQPGVRDAVLPSVMGLLSETAVVLLDDGLRDSEIQAARLWSGAFGFKRRLLLAGGKGLWVFRPGI